MIYYDRVMIQGFPMNKNDVKIKSETWLHRGFLSVKHFLVQHKLFSGEWGSALSREILMRADAAGVLLYDPILDKVVMIEQFRLGAMKDRHTPWLIEIVAGIQEPNESVEALIKRETKEEAGLELLDSLLISEYWVSPGGSTERISLFCGKVDASAAGGVHGLPDEGEDIRVLVMDVDEAFDKVKKNIINNAMSIIALMWLELNKEKIRCMWT